MSHSEIPQTLNQMPPEMVVMQMITGSWASQVIYVAAKLGIADLLKDGAKSCNELAQATDTHPRTLYRLMRALASLGVFVENEQGNFTSAPLSTYLQSDVPGSLRAIAIMMGEEHYQAWGNLLYSIRTGETAFDQSYGMNVFEYYAQNPEPADIFDRAMTSFSSVVIPAVVKGFDFSGIQTLVDVAGGHGSLIAAILKANPTMKGVLFDQPSVIEGARPLMEAEGVSERCQLVGGNFFESVPQGSDAYLMKHIIHDWDDERSTKILKNCHQAMVDNGKLLLVEQVIPPSNQPSFATLADLNMLVMAPGGCERTESEYRKLLESAGFQLTKIIPTESMVSIIEAVRV